MRRRLLGSGALVAMRAASLVAVTGLATGGLLLGTTAAAGASTIGGTIPYSCQVGASSPTGKGLIQATFNIGVTATVPATVAPGGTFDLTNVQTSTTIPASLVTTLVQLLKVSSFSGNVQTFDFDATGASPAAVNGAGGASYNVKVKVNEPATIVVPAVPESVGPFTAGSSGTVTIVPGNVLISTTIAGAPSYVICTPPTSIPASETASITIKAGGPTVPPTKTGEPWAGWPYWVIIGVIGAAGVGSIERALRIRRRRA